MIPDEAVHPPFEPTPEEANPWDHIAPKFTGVPRHFDHVVDDILKPHGGSMDTFLKALNDAKVTPEDMLTLTDALEKIQTFLDSPPKDPDFEHLTVMKEINLDAHLKKREWPRSILGTNEGDIVVSTDNRIYRFDKDGTLLFNTLIGHRTQQLIYEPINEKVFFTTMSEYGALNLYELDKKGVVSVLLCTDKHVIMDVLPDPQGELILVKSKTDVVAHDLNISSFDPDTRQITATHDVHISGDYNATPCILTNGLLVIREKNALAFVDTKTGTLKEMSYDNRAFWVVELPDGKIACVDSISESISLDVIDLSIAQVVRSNHINLPNHLYGDFLGLSGPDILPSGKVIQINCHNSASTGMIGYFLQTWDTTSGAMYDVVELPKRPSKFCVAPDGKIIVTYNSNRDTGIGGKIQIFG